MLSKKLPLKKTVFLFLAIIIAGLFLTNINSTEAVAWKTITDLPGLPAGSAVSLSDFIIVLYDFLLSAVGIAAMFMIVVGGFRYLTAAGNAASMAEAKDIIYSALYGLILALSTWIIVSTINPDLLYLKKPGTTVSHTDYSCMSSSLSCNTDAAKDGCNAGSLVDPDCNLPGATCASGDGCVFGPCDPPDPDCNYTTANCCYGVCDAPSNGECPERPISCVDPTSPLSGYDDGGVVKCKCINEVEITIGANSNCNEACLISNNCTKIGFKLGKASIADAFHMDNDKIRARAFAIDGGEMWDHATEIVEGCNLYVNAADYTIRLDDIVYMKVDRGIPSFDGDCFNAAKPLLDLLAQPFPGYYGPQPPNSTWLGCFMNDIVADYSSWDANVALGLCKKVDNPESVTCPIRMCVEYSDGTREETIRYLRMLKP